jgi:hypothetical protein
VTPEYEYYMWASTPEVGAALSMTYVTGQPTINIFVGCGQV